MLKWTNGLHNKGHKTATLSNVLEIIMLEAAIYLK